MLRLRHKRGLRSLYVEFGGSTPHTHDGGFTLGLGVGHKSIVGTDILHRKSPDVGL